MEGTLRKPQDAVALGARCSVAQRIGRLDHDVFFFNDTATTEIYTTYDTLSLHDALPISLSGSAVLGVAWALRTLAGLPDWFFPAAVLLLALGLPVVVLATMLHNRRLAGAGRAPLAVPGVVHRRLTLRGAVWGGVMAFSALGVVTATYMGMRVLGIGPVGTLLASGKLRERDRLVIADFANQTRDALLGPAVTEAFRVDFSQSTLVSPVAADYVRRVLRRMQRPDTASVDEGVAREIAQRAGIKAVVAGELRQAGPSILISAQLVSAES